MQTSAQGHVCVYRKKMLLPGGVQPLNVNTLSRGHCYCSFRISSREKTASG